jgi:NAD-dependent deacetylase sirtuin 2
MGSCDPAAALPSLPEGMPSRDARGVAAYIRSGKCTSVAFLTGAGVSVAAGIPDFRSPGGMYATLRPELLTASERERTAMRRDPTTAVSSGLFRTNQLPYLELRRPFILGVAERRWKPTLAHWFARVCHDTGLLTRVFTQNIDGMVGRCRCRLPV